MNVKPTKPITSLTLLAWFVALLAVCAAVMFACSFVGQIDVLDATDGEFWKSPSWQMRIYRLCAAAAVGLALASAGLAMQGILRNPLAEPYILGISSGAGLCVLIAQSIATAFVLPEWAITPAMAMIGAMVTALVVYGIAQRRGRLDPYVLLLAGVIVNVFNGALVMAVLQFVKKTDMIHFVGWSMGFIPESFVDQTPLLGLAWGLVLAGWFVLQLRAGALNTLGLGDAVASSCGVPVHRLRVEIFIVVSLMTAAAVALAGPVGFVGLIVPHVCRMILGPDHRRLVIFSGFGGAIFLMAADTLCRVLSQFSGAGELPVGVITALAGGPFFIYLLRKRRREVMA